MKKFILIILFLNVFSLFFGLNPKDYKKIELQEFLKFFNQTPGTSYFGISMYQMKINLPSHPIPIDDQDKKNITKAHTISNIESQESIDMYTYKVQLDFPPVVTYRDYCKIILYFQDDLVQYVKKEVKKNGKIKIYFVLTFIDTFYQQAFLLITGFETL